MPKYLTAREIRERFEVAFTTHQADALTEVMSVIETERVAEMAEIRENLTTLVEVTTRLAQAQARTDESVKGLAQAQQRTEGRVTRLEDAVEKLVEAQARTDESVKVLAHAQVQTDVAIQKLSLRIDDLAVQVGGLSNRFGFSLEEFSQALLPPWLEHYYRITDLYLNVRILNCLLANTLKPIWSAKENASATLLRIEGGF